MSSPFATLFRSGVRWCAQTVLTLGFWTVWIALAILLAAQLYIARTNELELPKFVQRALERRLAISGIHILFGKTRFDPSGRILVENVRLTLPGFEEQLVTARAIYARIDPWAMLANRFEPLELQVMGVSLRVPAMLSPSGKADEVVRDLYGFFVPRGDELVIKYARYHLGKLAVSVRGGIGLGNFQGGGESALPVADFLAHNYPGLSRSAAAVIASLDAFDRPILFARLTPAHEGGAVIDATLLADGLGLQHPFPLEAKRLSARAEVSFSGHPPDALGMAVTAEELDLSRWGGVGHGLRAWVQLRLKPGFFASFAAPSIGAGEVRAIAADFSAAGLSMQSPMLSANLTSPVPAGRRLRAELQGLVWSQAVSVEAEVDPDRRSGEIRFRGGVGSDFIGFLHERWHRDLSRWIAFTAPANLEGSAELGPGWAFLHAAGKLAATDLTVKNVHLDEVAGRFEFDGRHLVAPEAFARLGQDFARGRYEEDVATLDYRFLLEGRLQPLKITPWIAGNWWPAFFGNFAFSAESPALNFDMKSCWSNGRKAAVFVSIDCLKPIIRGVDFDRIRTRLFIRPQLEDGLDFQLVRGAGAAGGTFTRRIDLDTGGLQSLDFDIASTLGLDQIKKIMGPASTPTALTLFASDRPPEIKIRGRLDGPAAAGGAHQMLHVEAAAEGGFRYREFPLEGASFAADIRDNDIALDRVNAGFAGGKLTGQGGLAGQGPKRSFSFETHLRDASLGQAVSILGAYSAKQANRSISAPADFGRSKANVRLDLDASAQGQLEDPASYRGGGSANLSGSGLGEIPMLGLLSALLRFTSLRFTTAHAIFNLDGRQLLFSEVTVTGANSAIEAHGTYALDRHQLDFRATVNPFKESKSLPQKFMDVMLTPLSDVLAVRLVGTLEKPKWIFVNGPTSFMRNVEPAASIPSPLKLP